MDEPTVCSVTACLSLDGLPDVDTTPLLRLLGHWLAFSLLQHHLGHLALVDWPLTTDQYAYRFTGFGMNIGCITPMPGGLRLTLFGCHRARFADWPGYGLG